MTSSRNEVDRTEARRKRLSEIANTLEWLTIAFILAFVFRAFALEAFRIPSGSMADTLKGDHFRLRCLQCGYRYDYDFGPQSYHTQQKTRCPNCGYFQPTGPPDSASNGDRVLVLKCIYQFFQPKQWDVMVFKNPLEPRINYIKRLIAQPGQTVEIIDGDIYIDGFISRKPPKVQNELWMPVYNNDYQPVRPNDGHFNGHRWRQPFRNTPHSKWEFNVGQNPALFGLNSSPNRVNTMVYDTNIGNDFRASYAYGRPEAYRYLPFCSDLMVRFYVNPAGPQGLIGIGLSKYQTLYKACLDFNGDMIIAKVENGKRLLQLAHRSLTPPVTDKPVLVKFAILDQRLIFQFGSERLIFDLGRDPDDASPRRPDIEPQVTIFGAGKLTLSHLAVFRDTHYTTARFGINRTSRAAEGKPFKLKEDEFFVLGDNSPDSHDSRWWPTEGIGNNGRSYRAGIVPRDYLVGKAILVYWPTRLRAFSGSQIAPIPNIGDIRFIYGGSNEDL